MTETTAHHFFGQYAPYSRSPKGTVSDGVFTVSGGALHYRTGFLHRPRFPVCFLSIFCKPASKQVLYRYRLGGSAALHPHTERTEGHERARYSTELASHICNILDASQWHYEFDAETGILYFCFAVDSKLESTNIVLKVQRNQYVLYAVLPLAAPTENPKTMQRMCEFTVCANYGLHIGNFEMDMRDGELRYHTYVDCDGQFPSDKVVRNSIQIAMQMLERYTDAILEVLFGDDRRPVADIVEECERSASKRLTRQLMDRLSRLGDDVPEGLLQMIKEAGIGILQEDDDKDGEENDAFTDANDED